jgi:hypothetical protein
MGKNEKIIDEKEYVMRKIEKTQERKKNKNTEERKDKKVVRND